MSWRIYAVPFFLYSNQTFKLKKVLRVYELCAVGGILLPYRWSSTELLIVGLLDVFFCGCWQMYFMLWDLGDGFCVFMIWKQKISPN